MHEEFDNTNEKQNKKGNPNWEKGKSANPDGRPKGSLNEVTRFRNAVEEFEKEQGKDIYKIILERALRNPTTLIAVFKALVPQKTEIDLPEPVEIKLTKDYED